MGEQAVAGTWGISSVGRAPALQAGGQEFESLHLHFVPPGGTLRVPAQARKQSFLAGAAAQNTFSVHRVFVSKLPKRSGRRKCFVP